MKAAIYSQFGDPETVIHCTETEKPTPQENEVLIKMHLSPIHNHDLWTIRGNYGYKPNLPAIAGTEAVGTIVENGSGVTHLSIGQRVSVANIQNTWAEYFTVSAQQVVPIPDTLPDEIAAQVIAMPFSCLTLLEFINAKADEWIILNAANGTVGKTTALLAQARGINVINLIRRHSDITHLNALGIKHAIATEDTNWMAQVKNLVANGNLVAGVDSIGGKASFEMAQVLSPQANLISFGTMSGEPMQIATEDLVFKQIVVKGFWGSLVSQSMSTDTKKRLFNELFEQVLSGKISLPVDAIFSLDDIKNAISASLRAGKQGKVLIRG
ncbi:hypothetical protein QV08_03670 [Gallibacterium salpingitidis]|uniref:enoyl-[acyl-carrier-protein] reductase n=1 Tax=Gallibacterium salpingitidis TaxID=505341 RepID=A0AB36E3S1_9PAST|nr:zinc-binding dehydrogenase [Gallibacterium salpingitidis]OBX08676.1 hypothetical protein QV08_03670 [Gallibacterium salpingitidis]OBX10401.1 hypothetical protein QV09_06105 [Gallibacterium salpingitidis]